jgi:membrane-associated protease RseP (regulator of RpoE activity)
VSEFGRVSTPLDLGLLLNGFWYSGTLLAILGAHEFGHYYYCRRYDVDATLPYFIPAPIPLTGTLGAVIKIREAFPTRTVLFDIGVAGPIAGFVVLVPALFYGLSLSNLLPEPTDVEGMLFLGEPLLFHWAPGWSSGRSRRGWR